MSHSKKYIVVNCNGRRPLFLKRLEEENRVWSYNLESAQKYSRSQINKIIRHKLWKPGHWEIMSEKMTLIYTIMHT